MPAPLFMASTAFLDSEPKDIEEMFISEISAGWVQSGPPIRTVGICSGGFTGAVECSRNS